MRDRFVEERLPPPELLPEFRFDLPELQYPERLNAAAELMKGGDPEALAVINDHGGWTYAEIDVCSAGASAGCSSRKKGWFPATACFFAGRTR